MDITRNKFSNAVCVIFSVVLLGLFCVFTRYRLGLDNMVSCAIIAAVLCGIVACLIFFLNRIINKFCQGKTINDRLIFNIVIIVISLIFVVIRLLMISNVIDVPMKLGNIYDNAISKDGGIFVNLSTVEGIMATIISTFIKVLGNSSFSIILVQLILSIVSFVFLLFGIKDLMGRMATIAVCLAVAIGQNFYSAVASDSINNLILCAFSLIVFLSSRYKKSMDDYKVRWYFTLLIGILLGIFGLYSKVFLFLPVIPIIVLWDCNSESNPTKAGHTVLMLVGVIGTIVTSFVVDAFLLGNGGIDGFIDSVINFYNSRFGFKVSLSVIEKLLSRPGMLIVLLLCIGYCVLFWKNNDDAGHIMATFAILLLCQMFVAPSTPANIFVMLVILALSAIAGYSIVNIGYDPNQSDVYRIDDDMQPAVVQAIGNKVVASDEEIQKAFAESEEKAESQSIIPQEEKVEEIAKETATLKVAEIEKTVEEAQAVTYTASDVVVQAVTDAAKDGVAETVTDIASDEVAEAVNDVVSEEVAQTMTNIANNQTVEVNKDDKTSNDNEHFEERKPEDFGMSNSDFASMFSGSTIPPKFARNDYYDDFEEIEEETEEVSEDIIDEENIETESVAETNSEDDDSKDKKAYVDTFFSYLYDESVFDQPIEVPEEKVVPEEKYVSNAAKFSDLDIDLGFDAFDYVPEDSTEQEVGTTTNEEVETTTIGEEETVTVEEVETTTIGEEENVTIEEVEAITYEVEETISNEDNSLENMTNEWDETQSNKLEESLDNYSQSVEAEIFKALADFTDKNEGNYSVEEEIEKKIMEEDFSYEDAINKRLAQEEINEQNGFSIEEALEKKIEVEETLKNAEERLQFSYEEVLSNKLALEESLDALDVTDLSAEEVIAQKVELEEAISRLDDSDSISIQEAIERKIDVERDIKDAIEKPVMDAIDEFESVEQSITKDINEYTLYDFSFQENVSSVIINEEVDFGTLTDEISFEEKTEPVIEEISFEEETEPIEEEFSFEEKAEPIEEELSFEEKVEPIAEEFSFEEKVEPIEEEFSFEEKVEPIEEEFSFEEKVEPVADEYSFEEKSEPVVDAFAFEEKAEPVIDEFSFEEKAEPVIDEISFEEKAESVVDEFSFEENNEPVEDEFSYEENTESVAEETVVEDNKEAETEVSFVEETSKVNDEPKQIEFIENPLPLPKKHVHRELDYGRSVPENWMHYDVEINSKNNFYDI